jgi:hypothetical protein
MYFAFMAAWLNLFQLLGNLAWVTLAAGALALAVGADQHQGFFCLRARRVAVDSGIRKPAIYQRARAILAAGSVPAMLARDGAARGGGQFLRTACAPPVFPWSTRAC